MKKQAKGYALVFTLVVIMFLVVLSTAVASLATASYVNSIQTERNSKLKLAAEAGVDRAQVALKNYISSNPDVILNSSTIAISEAQALVKGDVTAANNPSDGITTEVKLSIKDDMEEAVTGRIINAIEIHSVATDTKNSRTKTVDAIIDKDNVTNIYFNRLFGSCFTTASYHGNTSVFTVSGGNLDLSGDMYLQANNISFQANTFTMHSGDIYVKNAMSLPVSLNPNHPDGNINRFVDSSSGITASGWQSINIRPLSLLGILDPLSFRQADDIQTNFDDLNSDGYNVLDFSYIRRQEPLNGSTMSLITYKAKAPAGRKLSLSDLIDGNNVGRDNPDYHKDTDKYPKTIPDGLYSYIVYDILMEDPEFLKYGTSIYDAYGKIYKLILIDGDLNIDVKPNENFDNYIIYCTGTVTFTKGTARFFNSSIFANNIVYSGVSTDTLTFYGANTDKIGSHSIGANPLERFSEGDRKIINRYLLANLENYGDFMQFKTLSWKEY